MKYIVQIFVYIMLQHLPFIGTVTIDFNSIGYIEESIVLQCQDINPIADSSVEWYRGGSLMDISSSRYTKTKTPTGFNLTISSLVTADGGIYRCSIDFGTSATKSLTIYYNTKNVNITKLNPKGIEITFIAFPDPVYEATVKQDGIHLDVNWIVNKSTQANGAIRVSLQNSTAFINQNKNYTVHVKITSPVTLDVETNISWVSDQTTNSTSSTNSTKTFTSGDHYPVELKITVGIGLAITIIGFIIWIVLFIVKGDQFWLGLGICSVIKIIGCIISIVVLALKGYQLSLGLGICFGIIILACIICIITLVFVKNGDYLRRGHCICFAIITIVCISCIVILTKIGVECPEKFLVGLGIGFGILIIVCVISILILVFFKKGKDEHNLEKKNLSDGSEMQMMSEGVEWK